MYEKSGAVSKLASCQFLNQGGTPSLDILSESPGPQDLVIVFRILRALVSLQLAHIQILDFHSLKEICKLFIFPTSRIFLIAQLSCVPPFVFLPGLQFASFPHLFLHLYELWFVSGHLQLAHIPDQVILIFVEVGPVCAYWICVASLEYNKWHPPCNLVVRASQLVMEITNWEITFPFEISWKIYTKT